MKVNTGSEASSASRPPTIGDVARVAGVSVPTVSRVLTGNVPVSPARRERVLAAIEELGYRPNAAARALQSGRGSAIAAVTGNLTRYGYATTLTGIEERIRASGYSMVVTVVDDGDERSIQSALDLLRSQTVVGAVVLDFDEAGHSVLKTLPVGLTVAVAGAAAPARGSTTPRAFLADTRAAREATEYLLELGHPTVHHISLPSSGRRSGRTSGWAAALKAADRPIPDALDVSWDPLDGHRAGRVLAADPDVSAVLAGNDEVAVGVIRAMTEAGRRVPEDVSVVGFDDQPVASLWTPTLTTVAQDFAALGRLSADLLLAQLAGSDWSNHSVAAKLVVRESAGRYRRRS